MRLLKTGLFAVLSLCLPDLSFRVERSLQRPHVTCCRGWPARVWSMPRSDSAQPSTPGRQYRERMGGLDRGREIYKRVSENKKDRELGRKTKKNGL